MSKSIDIKNVAFKKIVELLKKENPNSIFNVSQGLVIFDNQKVQNIGWNNTLKLENVSKKNQELLEKNFGFKKEKINYIKSPSRYKTGLLYYDYFDKDNKKFGNLGITELLKFQKQIKKIKNYYAFKYYYPLEHQLMDEIIYLNTKTGTWSENNNGSDFILYKF